jgi:hypothetical protein
LEQLEHSRNNWNIGTTGTQEQLDTSVIGTTGTQEQREHSGTSRSTGTLEQQEHLEHWINQEHWNTSNKATTNRSPHRDLLILLHMKAG